MNYDEVTKDLAIQTMRQATRVVESINKGGKVPLILSVDIRNLRDQTVATSVLEAVLDALDLREDPRLAGGIWMIPKGKQP